MTEKILDSLKKFLDLTPEVSNFDSQLLDLLNDSLLSLRHLGVISNPTSFIITKDTLLDDLLMVEDFKASAKIYMFISTRLIFDPPTNTQYKTILESKVSKLEAEFSFYEVIPESPIEEPEEE